MTTVRLGLIGAGNIGNLHTDYLVANKVKNCKLTAICDINTQKLESIKSKISADVLLFENFNDLINSGDVDAVLIATPHYDHPIIAIKALGKGLHVLIEKPAGVYTKNVGELNEVAKKSGKVFGIMYNQRTNPLYKKVKDLVDSGELGEIKRTNWIVTNWYRSQSYYDSGGWRATWEGEGGGVLLNQDPHQLDLWQWICGMPKRVMAFCYFGKHRKIEVEDEVTAYVEYENGATGVFITTTGEAPGTNRFEIVGDKGTIIIEDDKLTFKRLRVSETEFNNTFTGGFGEPECWKCEVPVEGEFTQHMGITSNFIDAIVNNTKLIAPGEEGIKGLSISNAMHLSTWINGWVDMPLDEDLFYEELTNKINNSKFKKEKVDEVILNTSGTY